MPGKYDTKFYSGNRRAIKQAQPFKSVTDIEWFDLKDVKPFRAFTEEEWYKSEEKKRYSKRKK